MESRKYCARCGAFIADEYSCDWYRFIRLKYCTTCAAALQAEAKREFKRKTRRDTKAKLKDARDMIARLEAENEALREKLMERR